LSKFIIPDYEVFDKGYSKGKLMEVCQTYGFPHPKTIHINKDSIKDLDFVFPAILKPNYTTGGRGMAYVKNIEELKSILNTTIDEYGDCHLQEFIEPGGKQIKVQLFVNKESQLLYSSVIHKQRYYPENGGSSCCNVTIKEENLVDICYQVLKSINWIGFADFDLIED